MSSTAHKVSTSARMVFALYNSSNALVTGEAANFTTNLLKDGAADVTAVSVAEAGSTGIYSATFTPGSTGHWYLLARHATHAPRGFQESWDVTTHGSDLAAGATAGAPTANQNADALLDRTNGVETDVTLRQALQRIGAAAAGKCTVSGDGTTITFTGLDGSTVRLTVTANPETGARTAAAGA